MRKLLLLLTLLAAGCTTIGHVEPPADRPLLTVREHAVPPAVVWQHCYPFVPTWQKLLGAVPEGCAVIRFDAMTCDIYLPTIDGTVAERILKHERDHCELRDHFGTSQLASAWAVWKTHMTRGNSVYAYIRWDGQTVYEQPHDR